MDWTSFFSIPRVNQKGKHPKDQKAGINSAEKQEKDE
jgi:hypothetical protein